MVTLPLALVGGFWLIYLLGYNMSIASAVGFIALGGVATEIGVVMLVYLNEAVETRIRDRRLQDEADLAQAVVEGAALRVRPVAMTVAVIIAGLLPIMWGSGTGSEVMRRIAAPMVGGIFTSFLLELLVYPAIYEVWRWNSDMKKLQIQTEDYAEQSATGLKLVPPSRISNATSD